MATKIKKYTSLEEIKQLIIDLSQDFYAFKTEIRKDIAELNNKFISLDNKVASLDNKVASLDNKVTKLQSDVREVKSGLKRLDRRVGNLIELFLAIPEFSFNNLNFTLTRQNEVFTDSKNPGKTFGEIDVIYSDDKNRALAFIEIKSYIKLQNVKELKTKATTLANLFKTENQNYKNYNIYWLFASYKVEDNALKEMKDFGFGLILLKKSHSRIEVKLKPHKIF